MSREPGRARIKLAKLLQEAFVEWARTHRPGDANLTQVTVSPYDLYDSKGAYRTDIRMDCGCWTGSGKFKNGDGAVSFGSYSTMTDCAARGIEAFTLDGTLYFDVYAKPKIVR